MSEEDAGACEGLRIQPAFPSLDAEQRVELRLPLPKKRLGHDQKDAAHAFGYQLRDNETSLDRFSEADLVGEDAAAFGNAPQREHDSVDLVGIRIDPSVTLT